MHRQDTSRSETGRVAGRLRGESDFCEEQPRDIISIVPNSLDTVKLYQPAMLLHGNKNVRQRAFLAVRAESSAHVFLSIVRFTLLDNGFVISPSSD